MEGQRTDFFAYLVRERELLTMVGGANRTGISKSFSHSPEVKLCFLEGQQNLGSFESWLTLQNLNLSLEFHYNMT